MVPRTQDDSRPRPARVLVAGCGYVGSALAARLASDGHAVWGLRRTGGSLPQGVRSFVADLAEPGSLVHLPPRLDFVFYTAAPDGSADGDYRAAYVEGPHNLLQALSRQAQRPRRVLFTSSTGVYAQAEGEWVDEDSPTEPASFSGRRLLEGERVFFERPFPATILRLGGIYGPGRTRLIDDVRAGRAVCPPGAPTWSNRIHLDDAAGALHHLMRLEQLEPVYVGVDREPAPLCDVLRWLADRLGAQPPRVAEAAEVGRGGRAGRRSNKRCCSRRLAASGYQFRYPTYRHGFESLLAPPPG